MVFGHYLSFLPLLVRDLGVAADDVVTTVGLLTTVSLLAGLPLVPFWGAWADRYSRKIIIVRSAVVEALLFVFLAFVTDVRQLLLVVPLVGLVLGNTGVMLAEITDRAPRIRLGLAISIVGVTGPLGLAVGPAFGGPIVDHYGLQTLFLVDAAITGLVVLALVVGYHEAADRVRSVLPVMTLVRRSLIAVLRDATRPGRVPDLLPGPARSAPGQPVPGAVRGEDQRPGAVGIDGRSRGGRRMASRRPSARRWRAHWRIASASGGCCSAPSPSRQRPPWSRRCSARSCHSASTTP